MLTIAQCPWTGPYSSDATKFDHSSPTIKALKRMMVREGRMTPPAGGMQKLTNDWPAGGKFDNAFRRWQRDNETPSDGVYGQQAWKYARAEKLPNGDYSLDLLAQQLIRDDWKAQHPPGEYEVRVALREFALAAIRNEDNWHYRMARPVDVSVDPAASYIWSDCSGFVIQAFHWARTKTGIDVPDPSKGGGAGEYSGYGNTDIYERDHPHVGPPFKIGDLAHYDGPTTHHVTLCMKGGDAETADWASHGWEAGPEQTKLYYRSGSRGLEFVVRPPLKR